MLKSNPIPSLERCGDPPRSGYSSGDQSRLAALAFVSVCEAPLGRVHLERADCVRLGVKTSDTFAKVAQRDSRGFTFRPEILPRFLKRDVITRRAFTFATSSMRRAGCLRFGHLWSVLLLRAFRRFQLGDLDRPNLFHDPAESCFVSVRKSCHCSGQYQLG